MSDAPRPTIWPAFKEEIDLDSAEQRGNNDVTFWSQARLHIILLTRMRLRGADDAGAHDCWYRFIATSQCLDADHPAQDRLAMQIMFARSLGTISQRSTDAANDVTQDGVNAQVDSPFLVEDLAATWQYDLPTMDPEQRTNFAAFVARLVAAGVGADRLGDLATTYVRDTLEHDGLRNLIAAEEARCAPSPDVVGILRQRLPVMRVLLQYCGHRIVMGRKGFEDITRWTTLLYAIEACFAEMGEESGYLREQARLASNWLGLFGDMVGIDRVPRPAVPR